MDKQEIEKISGDLVGYLHPEYFVEEFKNNILSGNNFNKETTEKYYKIIVSINWFLKKVSRYEIYFSEFYSQSEKIKNHEALEHHIHAYLEDTETLKNKLMHYIGCLKNDLKQIAINKKEISDALDWLKGQVVKTFSSVSAIRGEHRHKGYRFVDSNVIDIEMAETMLSETNPFKGQLTQYALEHFEKQKVESFEKGKLFWVETARKNLSQVEGVTNEILKKTKGFLYGLLDIKSLDYLYINKK